MLRWKNGRVDDGGGGGAGGDIKLRKFAVGGTDKAHN